MCIRFWLSLVSALLHNTSLSCELWFCLIFLLSAELCGSLYPLNVLYILNLKLLWHFVLCQILRVLITILGTSSDTRSLAVACYDLSQFIQYHPAGRIIVTDLKAKEQVMKLMNHDNGEVTKNALLCIQRLFLGAKYASFLQAWDHFLKMYLVFRNEIISMTGLFGVFALIIIMWGKDVGHVFQLLFKFMSERQLSFL